MARRKRLEKKSESSGGWMTTFSDLMSLLLTFFILLYSMSNVSETKFQAASQSIQMALSGTGGTSILEEANAVVEKEPTPSADNGIDPEVEELYEKVTTYVTENKMDSKVSVDMDKDGVYVDIQESVLFSSGSAEISNPGQQTLDILANLVSTFDNSIVIEGYTDNVPIKNSNFDSNWELSSGRAVSVLRYLSEEEDIEAHRLSAKGYGEYNPSVPNDTDENRAKNRRVNIVIVYDGQEAK